MQRRLILIATLVGVTMLAMDTVPVEAQRLVGDDVVRPWGDGVSPVFEGWYPDPDGDGYFISYGYLNRNSREVVEIPAGPANSVAPQEYDGRQPTHFETRRNYGWFVVHVPEDFGRDQIHWTIDFRGERYSIPGYITNSNYGIDAMYSPGTGLTPPVLRFDGVDGEIQGPHGNREPVTRTAVVGEPLELTVQAEDDTWFGAVDPEGTEIEPHPVSLRFYKYSGPGEVTFGSDNIRVTPGEEAVESTNTASFSEPGEYVVYIRANNESLVGAGQEQCCWTNLHVDVTVE